MHKALPNVSKRAKNRSLASFNRCLALKDRLLKFYPQEGTTSAGMAELLGLAGRRGEGRGSEASELQYHLKRQLGDVILIF